MIYEQKSLKTLAITGSLWTFFGYGATQVLRLMSNVILARLLFPEAFGLMALVSVVMQGLVMFSDIGLKPSIIQSERGDDLVFLNTAWTIQILRGIVLWIIACIGAYPFALIYDENLLSWMIPIAALSVLVTGFESTAIAIANRNIQIEKITLLELIGQLASIVVMILIAWLYKTVWALVAGGLVSAFIRVLLSHVWLAKTRNRFIWDKSAAHELIKFGKWIFVSTLLSFCVVQADRLVFGRLVPIGTLGIYSIALTLSMIPREILSRLGSVIVFPAYSRKYRETGSLKSTFQKVRFPLVILGGATTAFLLIAAPFIINILYDSRYSDAIWILQILTLGVWLDVLGCTNGSAFLAMGKPKIMALGSCMKLIGMVVTIPLCYFHWGFAGAVAGYAFSEIFRYMFSTVMISLNGMKVIVNDIALITVWCVTVIIGLLIPRLSIIVPLTDFLHILILGILISILWVPIFIRTTSIFKKINIS